MSERILLPRIEYSLLQSDATKTHSIIYDCHTGTTRRECTDKYRY